MWKILVAFIVFAAAALFFMFKAGGNINMQGEAGGHQEAEHVSAPAPDSSASK